MHVCNNLCVVIIHVSARVSMCVCVFVCVLIKGLHHSSMQLHPLPCTLHVDECPHVSFCVCVCVCMCVYVCSLCVLQLHAFCMCATLHMCVLICV